MTFSNQPKKIYAFIFIFISFIALYVYTNQVNRSYSPSINRTAIPVVTITTPVKNIDRILVIYVWANIDVQSLGNLQFFIRYGINSLQPADYYFILQKVNKTVIDESKMPILPSNAHYIQHDNECYDIGTMGWFLSQNIVNISLYKYFIFMNSSVRGPFLVPYFESLGIWWFHIFTSRINDEVKLIGPTINCHITPHVQSYVFVTDQVGLDLLRNNRSTVFLCHAGYEHAVLNGEVATSQLILRANYQIACLQSKYQGWDFRKKENQNCNSRISPIYHSGALDRISIDPYELIFVKYKGVSPFDTEIEQRATVYQKWIEERPRLQQNRTINRR